MRDKNISMGRGIHMGVNWTLMLAPAITLLLLVTPTAADSAASRQIAAPCPLVEEKATQYFGAHHFYTKREVEGDNIIVDLDGRKEISTPSAKLLSLNRSSVRKYTLPRHLSPLKSYDDFRLEGHLTLAKAIEGSCNATLRFEISAYEWVWSLPAIDDGYESKFISNGTLEKLYIESLGDLFTKAER